MTRHARLRALERDIRFDMVRYVINNPIETFFDQARGNYKSFAIVKHPSTRQESYLMVIHDNKLNTPVNIISTMWQTTGGLKRIGFSKV
jgi:uncharacterized protein DUF4258